MKAKTRIRSARQVQRDKRTRMKSRSMPLAARLLLACSILAGTTLAVAQSATEANTELPSRREDPPRVAQVVALDECDPTTFNAILGPDFCKNIALGFSTTFNDLFAEAAAGKPDPNWDFEPDTLKVREGTVVSVVDQGGEPHTFTEVKHFGGGFITGLNDGQPTVPECEGGFGKVDVAKTRLLQGSTFQVTDLKKGVHKFECCIHPWMRMEVEVK
jgi:plastocyanin